MSIHDIQYKLAGIQYELSTIELALDADKINKNLYKAAVAAEKELSWLLDFTGHGCVETMNLLRRGIEDYNRVKEYV